MRSMSNQSDAFEPLISHWKALRRPSASRVASIVPDGAALELDDGLDRVVDLSLRDERLHDRRERGDLADQEPAQVDHMGREISDGARAGVLCAETPGVEARVLGPVLEIARAEVANLAEIAALDDLAREPHRRHEPVVEAAEMLDAG